MPRPGNMKDHGALLDFQPSIYGQEVSTDTTVNGAAVDGRKALTILALCEVGAENNADNTHDFTFKLQESADGATDWTDCVGADVSAASTSDTPDQLLELRYNAEVGEGYYRVVATSTGTGGTGVAVVISAHIVLAGLIEGVPTSA